MEDSLLHRKHLRMTGYDYSQAAGFFITICTFQRVQSLARISDSQPVLTALGELARCTWLMLPQWYSIITLDAYVIMPNHLHGVILVIPKATGQASYSTQPSLSLPLNEGQTQVAGYSHASSLPSYIRSFKSAVTREWNRKSKTAAPVWQRSFYDHIIRDEYSLSRIREYIAWNPAQWHLDRENSARSALNPFYGWLDEQGQQTPP